MAVWKLRAVFTHLHAVEFCARRFVRSATRFADAGLIASLLIAGGPAGICSRGDEERPCLLILMVELLSRGKHPGRSRAS